MTQTPPPSQQPADVLPTPDRAGAPSAAAAVEPVATSARSSAPVPATPTPPSGHRPSIGRIPVVDVGPVLEAGRWPAKAVVGEAVEVTATVFREGHDAVAATAVLVAPDGSDHSWVRMDVVNKGLDTYRAELVADAVGTWGFRVEGWSDPYGTWRHDAAVKVEAGVDVELMLAEGAALLERAAARPDVPAHHRSVLGEAVAGLRDTHRQPADRLAAGLAPQVEAALAEHPVREFLSPSPVYPLVVQRERALVGSWYEFFPRSEGATYDEATGTWTSGTLRTAAERLPAIAAMGFDVVYLTPIHPIGTTHRKGRNNSLTTEPGDPGSPYAIGSEDGGHDAIHPELGTFDDFDFFVARARELGMEVALDVALQCSPDHPWVKEHPEWFTTRIDGTIAYAENPPKKYQDIYPLNFDNDPEGIYAEMRRMLQVWIDHGVTAFRVDNPHTKPLTFWERILGDIAERHPDVVFLSEAFTRPAMMHTLAKIGFHQSYTYFTWRNTKAELAEYLKEVSGPAAAYMRPSFWPTTHDILTPYMQHGGAAAFAIRAVLAATGSPTWGIYSGYELVENVPRPGVEEQIDNEKYEFKPRDWAAAEDLGIARLLGRLNQVRREHPALQRLRGLKVHRTSNDSILCFSRRVTASQSPTGQEDTVIVVVNTDPHNTRDAVVDLDLEAIGLASPQDEDAPVLAAHDLLSGAVYAWGAHPYVRLDPWAQCAHVISVRPL
ncbi:alpha-1,4-glucan--maltose-1-phosphate maltosyltransferase [Cellulomonas carbonis]|uniref:Alpha-1,4-glucan:maltose-1-phosphate maltosyltransferase n=1 Tax=Cellulomonas carbonis T26 TaxID=947969 RepID=A0A0A0BS40_9CELL|nr:alpha-1,4-glucan:maltose-1-phosphate maltosyltransferase [Cellulomonas carbonis T26]GGC12249.1 alpha-1,4-glucan:maltose-1-phosphate maltosyltransferase [Cellulomonas carbonis]